MRFVLTHIFVGLLFVLSFTSYSSGQTIYGTEDVGAFREGRDKEFRDRDESPLLDADFDGFKGLSYFDVDETFRVRAVFRSTPSESYFLMPTTAGTSEKFVKVGELEFELDYEIHILNAYQSEGMITDPEMKEKYGHLYFVPFRDKTNGATTYGGGRYFDFKKPERSEAIIDFNLAYNPSCAYGSDRYSCPIPPKANSLRIEIRAGEKIFAYTKDQHDK